MINEIGSPFEFAFKELLNGCKRMINENYPNSIFLFWGEYCYFQIDNVKSIFWLSHFDFDEMVKNNGLSEYEVMEAIDMVINNYEDNKNNERLEIMCWGELNSSMLKIEYAKGNFKPL